MKCDHNDQCLKIKSLKEKYKTRQNKHWPLKDIEVRSGAMDEMKIDTGPFICANLFFYETDPFKAKADFKC